MSGLFRLLFQRLQLPPASSIAGKTILITGATTGLGKEAARHVLALGAGVVILGVRNLTKGAQVKSDLERTVGNGDQPANGRILVWHIDLESFVSVQAFAATVREHVRGEGGRLDAAIMNAGLASVEWTRCETGWEKSLQVNVLSTALLSLHLLPLLLETRKQYPSSSPHLAVLTSDIHKYIKFPERREAKIIHALNDEAQWKKSQAAGGATERYGVSKLMDLFIAIKLSQLVPHDNQGRPLVIVNAVAPGFCKSELLTHEKVPLVLKIVEALIARTVEEGSKTLVHAVAQGPETHGKWLENQSIADPGSIVTSVEAAGVREKVWKDIIETLHDVDPTVQTEFC